MSVSQDSIQIPSFQQSTLPRETAITNAKYRDHDERFERSDVCFKRLTPCSREVVNRLWYAINKLFFDRNAVRVFHLLEVSTEVSTDDI